MTKVSSIFAAFLLFSLCAVIVSLSTSKRPAGLTKTLCPSNLACTVSALWKFTGAVQSYGVALVDLSSVQTLTNKTMMGRDSST